MNTMNKKIVLITLVAVIFSAVAGTMIGRNWTKFPASPTSPVAEQVHQSPVVASITSAK